jgi:beta-aspartyl-dipeptidase (metallo-type)
MLGSGDGAARTPALLKLVRARNVYTPEPVGGQNILIGGGKILTIGSELPPATLPNGMVEVVTLPKGKLIPGLIDQHQHFIGGGEGDGFDARMPELNPEAIAGAGITTAVGLLGTEIEAKSLTQLMRKAAELERAGLSTYIYTGAMSLPAPHLTQSVGSDIALIEKVIGAKSAIAERAFPNLDFAAFASLAGALVRARATTGKSAVLHLHVGRLRQGLEPLFELIDRIGFPPEQAVPTHINRSDEISPLFKQGIKFAKDGGNIDFTCCLGPKDNIASGIDVLDAVRRALDAGAPHDRITLSSDAGVAVPDPRERSGFRAVPPSILFRDLKRLAMEGGLGWASALPLVTSNVARVLGLSGRKGHIARGMDADLVLIGEDDEIAWVMSAGEVIFSNLDEGLHFRETERT